MSQLPVLTEAHTMDMRSYKWFYDNIHSHYYNLMMKWFSIPLGGETNFRRIMIALVSFKEREKILEMCCGTGGATLSIAQGAKEATEIIGVDLSSAEQ